MEALGVWSLVLTQYIVLNFPKPIYNRQTPAHPSIQGQEANIILIAQLSQRQTAKE